MKSTVPPYLEDKRVSRLQKKILTLMYAIIQKQDVEVHRNQYGLPTAWIYQIYLYKKLRENLKIHKLTFQEICERDGVSPKSILLKLRLMSPGYKERYLNQWDDDKFKASYYRSITHLYDKGLIQVAFTKTKPKVRMITFSDEGYKVVKNKILKRKFRATQKKGM